MKSIGIIIGSVLLGLAALAQRPSLQSTHVIDDSTYEQLLDAVFSYDSPPIDVELFVLRFVPSFQNEEQIVLRFSDHEVSITITSVTGESAFLLANQYYNRTGRQDVDEMTKFVKTTKKSLSIPTKRLKQLRSEFSKSARTTLDKIDSIGEITMKRGTVTAPLDGTIYRLDFIQGFNRFSLNIQDTNIDGMRVTGSYPLVRWMNQVRIEVLRFEAGNR